MLAREEGVETLIINLVDIRRITSFLTARLSYVEQLLKRKMSLQRVENLKQPCKKI